MFLERYIIVYGQAQKPKPEPKPDVHGRAENPKQGSTMAKTPKSSQAAKPEMPGRQEESKQSLTERKDTADTSKRGRVNVNGRVVVAVVVPCGSVILIAAVAVPYYRQRE